MLKKHKQKNIIIFKNQREMQQLITLGDKCKCKILSINKVGKDSSKSIGGLKFNLLSVSQLCDNSNQVIFDKENVW